MPIKLTPHEITAMGRLWTAEVTPPDGRGRPWRSPGPMTVGDLIAALRTEGCSQADIDRALREAWAPDSQRSKKGICAFCGAEVRIGQDAYDHARSHPIPPDAVLPRGCTHPPVFVDVWNRKAFIEGGWHTPGEESPDGILLQDGWTRQSAPDCVRRIVEDENGSSFEYVGDFFPRTEASAAALDVLYHQLLEGARRKR